MVWTIVRIIGRTGARSGSGVLGTPAPENLLANGLDDRPNNRVHDKKDKVRRWHKEGRYLIAHAHEGPMKGGSLPLIGFSWASAERSPPLLGVKDPRWHKEGRYLIAHAHEGTMKSGSPSTHWLFMGFGGAESAAPWLDGPGGEAPGLMRKSQNFSKSALTGWPCRAISS